MATPQPKVGLFGLLGIVLFFCWVLERSCGARPESSAHKPTPQSRASTPFVTSSKGIKTELDFEQSKFCRQYRCEESSHYTLQNGEVNHVYHTSLNQVGVELQTNARPNLAVTGLGLMFYERGRLSDEDFNVIDTLVRSGDSTVKWPARYLVPVRELV